MKLLNPENVGSSNPIFVGDDNRMKGGFLASNLSSGGRDRVPFDDAAVNGAEDDSLAILRSNGICHMYIGKNCFCRTFFESFGERSTEVRPKCPFAVATDKRASLERNGLGNMFGTPDS